tara:strand:+ start:159 stop:977 length:819 start_codon:yes stop_codon:yes gene_type:complete
MSELKFESNIPIIFLTIVVIAIVVIGYLEVKKINIRLDKLSSIVIQSSKGKMISNPNTESEDQTFEEDVVFKQEPVFNSKDKEDIVDDKYPEDTNKKVSMWDQGPKEDIIHRINRFEEVDDDEESDEEVSDEEVSDEEVSDEEIDVDYKDKEDGILMGYSMTNDYQNLSEEEDDGKEEEVEDEEEDDKEEDKEEDEGENEEENKEEDEEEDEEVEEIDLKQLSESDDDEFKKEKIIVDESYSVNQLKQICRNLKLSVSGSKSMLIQRIMENQ